MRASTLLNFIKNVLIEECAALSFLFVLAVACFVVLAVANILRRIFYGV